MVVILFGTSTASSIFSSEVTYVPAIAREDPELFKKICPGTPDPKVAGDVRERCGCLFFVGRYRSVAACGFNTEQNGVRDYLLGVAGSAESCCRASIAC